MNKNNEFNIKSSTIEKGLELAKEFLGKLVGPTIEELGLFIGDSIKYLRFKNQIKILLMAKEYVDKRGLDVKEIPIKMLVPLLENSSLEEDDKLQEKWAKMLTNMVDSELNLQNQIFPYLLGQISIQEYNGLKKLSEEEAEYLAKRAQLQLTQKSDHLLYNKELQELNRTIEQSGFWVDLEDYERANLVRLGLMKELPPRIYIPEFRTGGYHGEEWHKVKAEYDHGDFGYRITELGERFLEICELKERSK